jgi:hypothetical protein
MDPRSGLGRRGGELNLARDSNCQPSAVHARTDCAVPVPQVGAALLKCLYAFQGDWLVQWRDL